jgi:ureidoglycolate lyase
VSDLTLVPLPLTRERFAPYGDVIEAGPSATSAMNDARFERFDELCAVDTGDGNVAVGIAQSRTPSSLPLVVDLVERHPHGSQAFVPLSPCRMVVVVAPPGERVAAADLVAFETNGTQGINYRPGTWHMPLVAFESGQRFLIIERGVDRPNCDVHELDTRVTVVDPGAC